MQFTKRRSDFARTTTYTLTISDRELTRAELDDLYWLMRALEDQQLIDPTVEGALMILQMQARAIEKAERDHG